MHRHLHALPLHDMTIEQHPPQVEVTWSDTTGVALLVIGLWDPNQPWTSYQLLSADVTINRYHKVNQKAWDDIPVGRIVEVVEALRWRDTFNDLPRYSLDPDSMEELAEGARRRMVGLAKRMKTTLEGGDKRAAQDLLRDVRIEAVIAGRRARKRIAEASGLTDKELRNLIDQAERAAHRSLGRGIGG